MSVILITGAATGIGNLTARALAADGHTVYATVRDINGRNQEPVNELRTLARETDVDLRVRGDSKARKALRPAGRDDSDRRSTPQ